MAGQKSRPAFCPALENVLKVSNPLHLPPFLVCPKDFKPPIWGTLNLRTPQIGGLGGGSGNNFDFSNSLLEAKLCPDVAYENGGIIVKVIRIKDGIESWDDRNVVVDRVVVRGFKVKLSSAIPATG